MESQNECTEKGCSEQNGCRKQNVLLFLKKVRGAKGGGGYRERNGVQKREGGKRWGGGLQRAKRGAGVGQKMGVGGYRERNGVQKGRRERRANRFKSGAKSKKGCK